MNGQEYRDVVRRARTRIERGTAEDLAAAEEELDALRNIFPKQMEYICARVALMIARGEDSAKCRNVLDYTAQEYHPFQALADVFELKSRTFPEGSLAWRQTRFSHEYYQKGSLPQEQFARLYALRAKFLAEPSDTELLRALAEAYYVTRNMLAYFVLMMAYCRRMGREDYDDILVEDTGIPYPESFYRGNFGLLLRLFTDGGHNPFLLISTADDAADQEVLSHALELLGQQVICLRETEEIEMAQDMNDYALRCVQEACADGARIVLHVGRYRHADGREESAVPAAIRLLAKSLEQDAPLIVLTRDERMNELETGDALGRDIQRLSYCMPPQFSYAFAFAWAGDYLTYSSYFYGEDIAALLDAPATCDLSIVIPVRNAADTLKATLETCLAIDYDGSYEIVVSDNSDEGRDEVRCLVEELNDPHIRYYRTPFVLPLTKSFEFAYLHARGAFVFSIGADDGVFPWGLKYIKKAMEDYPNAPIFSWRRGLYTWPGFISAEEGDQIVPLFDTDQTEHYVIYPMRSDHAELALNIKPILYYIPLLYINSGFRRGYLREVLWRTGRMLDGISQDVYMGAVNLLLQEHVVELRCPITIAGMSGHSEGAASVKYALKVEDIPAPRPYIPLRARWGEYVPRRREMAIPYVLPADTFIFYMSLCRLADLGISPDFRPEQSYRELSQYIFLTDMRFERYWGLLLYASTQRGDAVYENCREIYEKICDHLQHMDDLSVVTICSREKGYAEQERTMTIDPTAFGCQNIADAVRLTAQLLHL